MCSVVARPENEADPVHLYPLAACLAVCDTVRDLLPSATVGIKWPNDVLIDGRKCSGILVETAPFGALDERPDYVVIGIGLNVNQQEFLESLYGNATSLAIETGSPLRREHVLARLLGRLEPALMGLRVHSPTQILDAYEERLLWVGRSVSVETGNGGHVLGILLGIDHRGALRLKVRSSEKTFHAGDVRLRADRNP
jgi:BirA family biotin operon repressor/biotin-[acetyl-CoA-carboxylase] ligase